jgi:hypothetical protein
MAAATLVNNNIGRQHIMEHKDLRSIAISMR